MDSHPVVVVVDEEQVADDAEGRLHGGQVVDEEQVADDAEGRNNGGQVEADVEADAKVAPQFYHEVWDGTQAQLPK